MGDNSYTLPNDSNERQYLTLFDENYFIKTYRGITSRPDLALTELVANSWDSGARNVRINIPLLSEIVDGIVSVEDDGAGMTPDEFNKRWMTLAYDRILNQGEFAENPFEETAHRRRAYGRNGIGRHGLFCFNDAYTVETWKDGITKTFRISLGSGHTPLNVQSEKKCDKTGHGTKVSAVIRRNAPDLINIRDIISARFMFDPNFHVFINDEEITLEEFSGVIQKDDLVTTEGIRLHVVILSSHATAKKTQQHGIAFWVNSRLVGEPGWTLGTQVLNDGRTTLARQYTIIVKSEDLINDVLEDWSGFENNSRVKGVYKTVSSYVTAFLIDAYREKRSEVRKEIVEKYSAGISQMERATRKEVITLLDEVMKDLPSVPQEYLEVTVQNMIAISQSTNKVTLLDRIFSLSEGDTVALNKILDNWDISDIEFVLDEIDRRLATVEAIERFSNVAGVDELHVLHPLVLEARWLFGPEYDSSFYTSNKALIRVLRDYLKCPDTANNLDSPRSRPDIILFGGGSLAGFATEWPNEAGISTIERVLVIELKCGGKEITSTEIQQTESYIEELHCSNALNAHAKINAFVVGAKVSNRVSNKRKFDDYGELQVCLYSQLVSTAKSRLFGLREQLSERYEAMGVEDLFIKALGQDGQQAIDYINNRSNTNAHKVV